MPTIYHLRNRAFLYGSELAKTPGFTLLATPADLFHADCVVVHLPSVIGSNDVRHLFNLRQMVPKQQVWVAETMESAGIYPHMDDPAFMALFDIEMSYRLSADVWTPYIPDIAKIENAWLVEGSDTSFRKHLCCAFISSRFDASGRRDYLTALSSRLDIHSYGRFMRNRRLVWDRGRKTKLRQLRRYRYTLAFENSISPDYVTEKFYDPLLTGTVPVYLGAPNIEDFAPGNDCYIDVRAFSGPDELARHIMTTDPSHYLAWHNAPLRNEFTAKLEHISTGWPDRLSNAIKACIQDKRRLAKPVSAPG